MLCIWHILSNVKNNFHKKWIEAIEAIDENDDNDENDESTAEAFDDSPMGAFLAFRRLLYANTIDDFKSTWIQMINTYKSQQSAILHYVEETYLEVKQQWAYCFTKNYRTFGEKANSFTEVSHRLLKLYLFIGTGDFLSLSNRIEQMLDNQERNYRARIADNEVKQRYLINREEWLSELPTQISFRAINLLIKQHKLVQAHEAEKRELRPCTGSFTEQFGLPYAHYILEKKTAPKPAPLEKHEIDRRWWLQKPLVKP